MKHCEFDYIIVGAGSAGCALANRLTEDGDATVLLVEAGGWDRDPLIHVPLGWGLIFTRRRHDWMYNTEPEPNIGGRPILCPRGKVVGGSSSINALAYVRGNSADYDRWAAAGLTEWSYRHLLPYMRRQESWEGGANAYRGGSGPISTRFARYSDPLIDGYFEGAASAGFAYTDDFNGVQQEGFGRAQVTIRDGRRCSSAVAYLHPARSRPNLSIEVKALVTGILLQRNRARGISFTQGGADHVVHARREVILCGGAINSPQLLMLAGIGDPDELARHDIPVRVALPGVGKNLKDHISAQVSYARPKPGPMHRLMRADRVAGAMASAYLLGRGPATDLPGGVSAFLKTQAGLRPDVQLVLSAAPFTAAPYMRPFKRSFQDEVGTRVVLLHPESSGDVRLASADPRDAVRIRQNFLSHDHEWRTLRDGLRMAESVFAQPALAPFAKDGQRRSRTDDQLDDFIRKTAITIQHPLGTCKMGLASDPTAVVDPELRVIGIEGLRVVDASVIPDMTSGNINAPVITFAERAADLIRGLEPLPQAVL